MSKGILYELDYTIMMFCGVFFISAFLALLKVWYKAENTDKSRADMKLYASIMVVIVLMLVIYYILTMRGWVV